MGAAAAKDEENTPLLAHGDEEMGLVRRPASLSPPASTVLRHCAVPKDRAVVRQLVAA